MKSEDYEKQFESDKPDRCASCEFKTEELIPCRRYDQSSVANRVKDDWLCNLCASTSAGTAQHYPRQYQGQIAVLSTMCYIGNELLAAVHPERVRIRDAQLARAFLRDFDTWRKAWQKARTDGVMNTGELQELEVAAEKMCLSRDFLGERL